MSWNAATSELPGHSGRRYVVRYSQQTLSNAEAISRLRKDAEFAAWLNAELADAPYAAFRWETPPVDAATTDKPWEFVVLNSPNLARPPERHQFAQHFASSVSTVATFANLRRDALLIAPTPIAEENAYGHLAAFVRQGPEEQRLALWKEVGEQVKRRLGTRPVWLSTAGAGVSWLHVRLDDSPKYYGYQPYRRWMAA
ncbi:hypothetical protein LOC68_09140 [Blastopirellula sp. JC732]|uniref:Uncharacterized protein n=1 Tax=Blastopirellula sediminis TaxID=2894196 RepID=A0A9X1MLR4_9BACT|nr:hypothetical protein [Blastopirellula sediminis]MCC9608663.1 hypothetical protein [Blastopirellula sediminis]MCC9628560.1 hypothetical protein [Blastopirellula sediminis]